MPPCFRTALLALALDLAFGEPPAPVHPVVWIGTLVGQIAQRAPAGSRSATVFGAAHLGLVATLTWAASAGLLIACRRLPQPLDWLVEAWLLKTALSLRGLVEATNTVRRALEAGDLAEARRAARALVSRPTDRLDPPMLASAAAESVAENLSDSVVAPLLYQALGGLRWAMIYRAVNTMDAMIGYRGAYEHSGKAAARADDLLNLAPARLSAALIVGGAALVGRDARGAWRTLQADCRRTASPNAGWPMSAMAGALGARLEKPGHYVLGARLAPANTVTIKGAVNVALAATALALPALLALSALTKANRR